MKRDINTIKNWFKTGLKPTQSQFWDWLDSFWHKDDDIPSAKIEGLGDALNGVSQYAETLSTQAQQNAENYADNKFDEIEEPAIIKIERTEIVDEEEVTITGYGLNIDRTERIPVWWRSIDLGFGEGGISGKYSFLVGEDNIDNGLGYNFISGGGNEISHEGSPWASFVTGWKNVIASSNSSFVTGGYNEVNGSGFLGVIGYDNKIYKGESAGGASYSLTVGTANTLYGNGGSLVVGWRINLKDSTKDIWSNKYNLISGHTFTLEDIMSSNISGHSHNIKFGWNNIIGGHRLTAENANSSIIGGGRNNVKNSSYNIISGNYNKATTLASEPEGTDGSDFSLISGQYNTATDAFFSNLLGERLENNYKHKTVFGKYNENKEDTYLEIGWGTANNDRRNIFEVWQDGRIIAPQLAIEDILSPKDLVTKEYVDAQNGAIPIQDTILTLGEGNDISDESFNGYVDIILGSGNTLKGVIQFSQIMGASNTLDSSTASVISGMGNTLDNLQSSLIVGNGHNLSDVNFSSVIGNSLTITGSTYASLIGGASSVIDNVNSSFVWLQGSSTIGNSRNNMLYGSIDLPGNLNNSIALGHIVKTDESNGDIVGSVLIGQYNQTDGQYNQIALGNGLVNRGAYSTLIGDNLKLLDTDTDTGIYNIMLGYNTNIDAASHHSIIIGTQIGITQDYVDNIGTAFGTEDDGSHIAIGWDLALGYTQIALGYKNEGKAYFEIGAGNDDDGRANLLEVYKDGTIIAPNTTLDKITDDKSLVTLGYLQSKFGYGSTANRPATPSVGFCYFNETLGKPEWYDGSNWVSW